VKVFAAAGAMKNTLSASDAGEELEKAFSGCGGFSLATVSDGGDGFLEFVKSAFPEAKEKKMKTLSCSLRQMTAKVLLTKDSVFVESASILKRDFKNLNILQRSSAGVGIIIKKIYDGKRRVYLGIGGTMTADIGCGMLEEMGCEVTRHPLTNVLMEAKCRMKYPLLTGISDVSNPLDTRNGASVYTGQKGASAEERILLRAFFDETAKRMRITGKRRMGSGGGLGAAVAIAGGKIADNFAFAERIQKLKQRINEADAVIVNEGNFDSQSLSGKLTGRIAEAGLRKGKRVFVIAGGFEAPLKGASFVKTAMPKAKTKEGYKREFYRAAKKTKELIYG